jgi:hypothetical protein
MYCNGNRVREPMSRQNSSFAIKACLAVLVSQGLDVNIEAKDGSGSTSRREYGGSCA